LAVDEVKKIVSELRSSGLNEKELERLKRFIVGSYEIELQRNSNQGVTLALNKLYGLSLDFATYTEGILKVTTDDINRAIEKYLDLDKYVLSVLSP